MTVQLYLGDCLDIVPTLEAHSVDAILTDIPYGTTACKWDSIIPFDDLWRIVKHVLKPRGVFVTTASQPFTSALVMSNVEWFKYEWIWKKNKSSNFLQANYQPIKIHENIIVFSNGNSTYTPDDNKAIYNPIFHGEQDSFNDGQGTDTSLKAWKDRRGNDYVLKSKRNPGKFPTSIIDIKQDGKQHPTQKPVALYEYLVRTYTNEGETVLDIAMGSGTTGVACVNTGRDFIGVEKEQEYYAIAERRIQEAQQQERMF